MRKRSRKDKGWSVNVTSMPMKGSYVRLKTVNEVCKLKNVRHWMDVWDPEIAEEMLHLFGTKVKVKYTSGNLFEVHDPEVGDTWHFHKDWIVDERFKIGLIPDELFEI